VNSVCDQLNRLVQQRLWDRRVDIGNAADEAVYRNLWVPLERPVKGVRLRIQTCMNVQTKAHLVDIRRMQNDRSSKSDKAENRQVLQEPQRS
jgi:hypothetical protein